MVTWGSAKCGGDSSSVQHQLKDVQDIAATSNAFAARLKDGSVVSWGGDRFPSSHEKVKDQMWDILEVHGCESTFTALRSDGHLICWDTWEDAHYTIDIDREL